MATEILVNIGSGNGERERDLSLSAFLGTEDIAVHIVHISLLIITYTLEQATGLDA